MIGLGIETSCDETAIAVVEDGKKCLSNIIFSQIQSHFPFGGVVPEIAGRLHLEKINYVYEQAMQKAGICLNELDYICVSTRPGLVGSLMIGAGFAKCLSLVSGLPIVPANHLEGHLYACCLEEWVPEYPFLGLLLSGGNSSIYLVHGPGKLTCLADTLDDACGEAFDKTSFILGLGYPGGPSVEKKASEYSYLNAQNTEKPIFRPLLKQFERDKIAFSFSGIKTAVILAHAKEVDSGRICRDFQTTVFELIERNLRKACRQTGIRRVVAGGGVLSNHSLRKVLNLLAEKESIEIIYPRQTLLCTDNGAMIASVGYYLKKHCQDSVYDSTQLSFSVFAKSDF